MNEGVFKEELLKHNVLDMKSCKVSKCIFNNVKNGFSAKFSSAVKISYALLSVKIAGGSGVKLYLDNVLIFDSDADLQDLIPIRVGVENEIVGVGSCDTILMFLIGASFVGVNKDYILPLKNTFVRFAGNGVQLCIYETLDDLVQDKFVSLVDYDNVVSVNSVFDDDALAMLKVDNGAYYYINTNNYTNGILVSDKASKATIVSMAGFTCVVYIDNGLNYKCIENGVLGEEKHIKTYNNRIPVDFGIVESSCSGICGFVVKWENGEYAFFVYENGIFVQKLTINADYIKIGLFENLLKLYVIDDYNIKIYDYQISKSNSDIQFKRLSVSAINNCDNVFWMDKLVVSNRGKYTIINEIY